MRTLIVHDDVVARAAPTADEVGVLSAVHGVADALQALGHDAFVLPVGTDFDAWTAGVRSTRPDIIFNLCEGVGGSSAHEPRVAAAIELMGVPITGSRSETLALGRRKDRVNAVLAAAGLPVPRWALWQPGEPLPVWRRFPAIVKPAAEDGSIGISQASVVEARRHLRRALGDAAAHAPLLVQNFVGTREIVAGLVGECVLPLAEIDFSEMPADHHRLVTYDAKWSPGSADDVGTRSVCPAPLDPGVRDRATAVARDAWRAVDGRGYGRVDLRIADDGEIHVIEVNPNPDLDPEAGLARMARTAGLGYVGLVERIVAEALR